MECQGITKEGLKCVRVVRDDNLCWQHKYQKNILDEKVSPYKTPESGKKFRVGLRQATDLISDLEDLAYSYFTIEELVDLFVDDYKTLDTIIKKYYQIDILEYKEIAIRTGNLELLKYLVYLGIKIDYNDLKNVIALDYLKMLKYILSISNYKLDIDDLNLAIQSGSYEIVKYQIDKLKIEPKYQSLDLSASTGNLKIMKLIIHQGIRPSRATLSDAIMSGNLEIVRYLVRLDIIPSASQKLLAKNLGFQEIVEYFNELGVGFPKVRYV